MYFVDSRPVSIDSSFLFPQSDVVGCIASWCHGGGSILTYSYFCSLLLLKRKIGWISCCFIARWACPCVITLEPVQEKNERNFALDVKQSKI
ncbi:hypothetical protein BDZ91DRAFT_713666 [Kalaharituber pfeilii]|nr:hypothetical protein BDZ91DRAFT_713666 [Kalaharituber pfeilii]